MALPQAEYLTFDTSGVTKEQLISADVGAAVCSNRTSLLPAVCTADALEECLGIAIENKVQGTLFLAHIPPNKPHHQRDALKEMLQLARRNKKDELNIHLIGAFSDADYDNKEAWENEIRSVIELINNSPNVTLKTCDVDNKPHPVTFALAYIDGKARLIRGTKDMSSMAEFDEIYERDEGGFYNQDKFNAKNAFDGVEAPEVEDHSSTKPFTLTWDGRLPENQDWEQNPHARRAVEGNGVGGSGRSAP